MALVSIIIVSWNGKSLLGRCLDSVYSQTFRDFEVVIVDNGSTDGSSEFVRSNFPHVRLVVLGENRGFTGGNNEGYHLVNGSLIVLLNNDIILRNNWLECMVSSMMSDMRLGSCASKILIDGTDLIDSAGDIFTTAFAGTKLGEFRRESDFEAPRFVAGPCAAAAIYRREMIEQIGFFDDDFFLNHEDTDLNMRAWFAGWHCKFVPDAVSYHRVSSTIGNLSNTSVYYFSRNSLWVWLKNVPLLLMIRFLPQRILYELNSFVNFCLIHGKWLPFIRGKWDALKGIPLTYHKRKQICKLIRLNHKQIATELEPITHYLFKRFWFVSGMYSKSRWF